MFVVIITKWVRLNYACCCLPCSLLLLWRTTVPTLIARPVPTTLVFAQFAKLPTTSTSHAYPAHPQSSTAPRAPTPKPPTPSSATPAPVDTLSTHPATPVWIVWVRTRTARVAQSKEISCNAPTAKLDSCWLNWRVNLVMQWLETAVSVIIRFCRWIASIATNNTTAAVLMPLHANYAQLWYQTVPNVPSRLLTKKLNAASASMARCFLKICTLAKTRAIWLWSWEWWLEWSW